MRPSGRQYRPGGHFSFPVPLVYDNRCEKIEHSGGVFIEKSREAVLQHVSPPHAGGDSIFRRMRWTY